MALKLAISGENHAVELVRRRPHLVLRIGGREHEMQSLYNQPGGRGIFVIDGVAGSFVLASSGDTVFIRHAGRTHTFDLIDPHAEAEAGDAAHDDIRAPMPGAVVSIQRHAGDVVARGETIMTIESMKLQTALAAPRDGVVREVLKDLGGTFDKNEIVVRLEPMGKV